MHRHASLFLILLFSLFPGCEKQSTTQGVAAVNGIVTLNDQPLENVTVTFTPVGKGGSSSAITDKQGRYRLRYSASTFGAIIGEHTVTVDREFSFTDETESDSEETPEDETYSEDFDPEEKLDDFENSIPNSDDVLVRIPDLYKHVKTSTLRVEVKDSQNDIPIELVSQ